MGDFITSENRVKTGEWDFQGDFYTTMTQLDRYFYVNYTSALLTEIEKIRMEVGVKRKGLFAFAKKAAGSQFVLEYEGVHGINKLGGHRQRMTDRINKVYKLIDKENSKKNEKINDRHLINTSILSVPFGGLEVAYNLMILLKSYEQLAKHQTKKLNISYEMEIWKWIFYWTTCSYGINKKQLYDIFNIHNTNTLFSGGATSKKIGNLIDFSKNLGNPNIQYLFRIYLLTYLTQVQDYLLQKEDELTDPEAMYEKKVYIDMLVKQLLFFLDRTERKKILLSPQEQRFIFILYPYHPVRIKKTISYFLTKRNIRQLAWQVKIIPDENFYWVINSLDNQGRKNLFRELRNISRIKKQPSDREKSLMTKLETKITKVFATNTNTNQTPGILTLPIASNQAEEKNTSASAKTSNSNDGSATPDQDENVLKDIFPDHLNILLETPFVVDIQLIKENSRNICATNLTQVLYLNNKSIFIETIKFLRKTSQLRIEKNELQEIWKRKEKILANKLSPMERLTLKDLCNSVVDTQFSSWKEMSSIFHVKVGRTSSYLREFEGKMLLILDKTVSQAKETWSDLREEREIFAKPLADFNTLVNNQIEKGVLQPEERIATHNCWKAYNFSYSNEK